MKQTKKIIVEQEVYVYFCDRCDIKMDYLQPCTICNRTVCRECGIYNPDDLCAGDYPDRYCRICWKIGEEFRKRINEALRQFHEAEDKIIKEWERACQNT